MTELSPDIIVSQEIVDESGADSLLESFRSFNPNFECSEFDDGPNTDNMLFYDSSIVSLIGQNSIETYIRYISEYILSLGGNEFRIYSCHLKASEFDEYERLEEITILRNYIDTLPSGTEFVICGDMNFYGSFELGYQKIIADEIVNIGRARDPLDMSGYWSDFPDSGNWHSNSTFADIHTQSTRTRSFGDGAAGGLDDRFDFILISYYLNNDMGIEYVEDSYTNFGNDGLHFNDSINESPNMAVSPEIANALHYASDHLPVYADFDVIPLFITDSKSIKSFQITVVPNPFNSSCAITAPAGAEIEIYDLRGNVVERFPSASSGNGIPVIEPAEMTTTREYIWHHDESITSGIYIVMARTEDGNCVTKRIVYIK